MNLSESQLELYLKELKEDVSRFKELQNENGLKYGKIIKVLKNKMQKEYESTEKMYKQKWTKFNEKEKIRTQSSNIRKEIRDLIKLRLEQLPKLHCKLEERLMLEKQEHYNFVRQNRKLQKTILKDRKTLTKLKKQLKRKLANSG